MMNRSGALALLALLLLPGTSLAQESTAPLRLLEEAAGDVVLDGSPSPVVMPAGLADDVDLVSFDLAETPLDFLFMLGVKSLANGDTRFLGTDHRLHFRHNDQDYAIDYYPGQGTAGTAQATLMTFEPGEEYGSQVADLPIAVDIAAGTMTATVLRDLLLDNEGAAPFPGRFLDQFRAESGYLSSSSIRVGGVGMPLPHVADRMPNDGIGPMAWPVQYGIVQTGHLRLASDEPFRASNGEASTFVYRVNATNLGPRDDFVEFVASGVPAAWDVRLPGLTELPANASIEFPVVVRTAFAHRHGSATTLTLEVVSQSDPGSVGRVQIGLRYPAIPQPAGHHNQLYLHSAQDTLSTLDTVLVTALGPVSRDWSKQAYFNTADPANDEQDDGIAIAGDLCDTQVLDEDVVTSTYCWSIPLLPGLQMGLDFDTSGTGTYSIPFQSTLLQLGARAQGRLVHLQPVAGRGFDPPNGTFTERDEVVVAVFSTSARADIPLNGKATFGGTITPTAESDFIPYVPGAALRLDLQLEVARPDNPFLTATAPDLIAGGLFTLPLFDYDDPIGDVFSDGGKLHLLLDGDVQQLGNPGSTLLFNATLHNADNATHELALLLVGSNVAWARIVGDERIEVEAGASRTLQVAVAVPADARDDDRADLVLDVASTSDVGARALVRMVGIVDTDATHPDATAYLSPTAGPKDTPGPPLVALAIALLALTLARRGQP